MDPLEYGEGLPLSGVAPEATIRMYRIFACNLRGGTDDLIIAAMTKAVEEGVDVLSMSLSSDTSVPVNGLGDPLADITKAVTDAGVAVVVANSNSGYSSPYGRQMYTVTFPALEPSSFSVGAIANQDWPLMYPVTDSSGAELQYASIWPVPGQELDVYMVQGGCSSDDWDQAIAEVQQAGKYDSTIMAVTRQRQLPPRRHHRLLHQRPSAAIRPRALERNVEYLQRAVHHPRRRSDQFFSVG